MAISISELQGSPVMQRDETGDVITHNYRVEGTNYAPDTVIFWPDHLAPHLIYPLMTLRSIRTRVPADENAVYLTMEYKVDRSADFVDGREYWEWDMGSTQEHITSVKQPSYQIHYPSASAVVGVAIGVNGDEVEGTDVFRPLTSLRIRKIVSYITADGVSALNNLQNTVNLYPWFGYLPGEVLFLGSRIANRPDGFIDLEMSFLIRKTAPPATFVLFNGSSVQVQAEAWDYLWLRYGNKPTYDGTQSYRVSTIQSLHIARVYERANFALFGLAGPWGL